MGVIGGGLIGWASAGLGGIVAGALTPLITTAGGFIGGAVSGFIGGAVGGFISGGFMSQLPGGNGDFWGGAFKGTVMGALGGAVIGGVVGGVKSLLNGKTFFKGNDIAPKVINPKPTATTASSIKAKSVHDVAPKNNLSNQKLDLKTPVGNNKAVTGVYKKIGLDGKAKFNLNKLPMQKHHFATNKHSLYTQKMDKIAAKFKLSLNGEWNQKLMPHLGRHPHTYHEFVLDGMQRAAYQAGSSQSKFLQYFNQYVIDPVIKNPELLRKSGWK